MNLGHHKLRSTTVLLDRREMGQKFNIEQCDEVEFERLFRSCSVIYVCVYNLLLLCFRYRFKKADSEQLLVALRVPSRYHCEQKTVTTGMEALLILLRHKAYPSR